MNHDSQGRFKANQFDGQRKRRSRRTPQEVAAAIERQRQLRADLDAMTSRHFPSLAKAEKQEGR